MGVLYIVIVLKYKSYKSILKLINDNQGWLIGSMTFWGPWAN